MPGKKIDKKTKNKGKKTKHIYKGKTSKDLKRQHRDTIFRWIFKDLHNFLQLLKWCRGEEIGLTAEDIIPFDLDSELAVRVRRNDVSFITKDNRLIILVEHQSTICPNMAFRLFLYYIELIQLWIKLNEINIYGQSKIPTLPVPEFYVVYNGTKPLESEYSMFELKYEGIKINVKVKMVDIHFVELKETEATNTLTGYAFFYKIYDDGIQQGLTRELAFDVARDECIKHGYLHGYVEREDFVMFYKDFLDYDTQLKQEGKAEGILEAAIRMVKNGIDFKLVAETLQLSDLEIEQLENVLA